MAIIMNGVEVENSTYEGTTLDTITYNGTTVWQHIDEKADMGMPDIDIDIDISFELFEIPAENTLYGVAFDENGEYASDGVAGCVYTDDAVGFTAATVDTTSTPVYSDGGWDSRWPYNQLKPCLIKDGVITYLDPTVTRLTQTVGGETVVTTGADGNLFLEIPRIYYRYHLTDNGVYEFKISDCKRPGFCDLAHTYKGEKKDKIYVGLFATNLDTTNNKALSVSNVNKLNAYNYTTAELRAVSYLNGDGYEMMTLNVLNLLEMLFIIEFKSIDYKTSIGQGYSYNSYTLSTKKTGNSLSYPSRTYGYGSSETKKADRFHFIEGFASFANFAIDGTDVDPKKIGFMNVEGKDENWIDDTDKTDYMFFDVNFPVGTVTATKRYVVDNKFGMLPVEFVSDEETAKFDFFKSRANAETAGAEYRLHFPNLGATSLGVFSYNMPVTTYKSGIQGHRMVYYGGGTQE